MFLTIRDNRNILKSKFRKYETQARDITEIPNYVTSQFHFIRISVISRATTFGAFETQDHKTPTNGGVGAVSCTGNSNILGIGLDSPIPNIKKNLQDQRKSRLRRRWTLKIRYVDAGCSWI